MRLLALQLAAATVLVAGYASASIHSLLRLEARKEETR